MKLDEFDVDLLPDELSKLNSPDTFRKGLKADDVRLSMSLPIVVKYDYVDLNLTDYHFCQDFTLRDTQTYFAMMKEISSNTIDKLTDRAKRERGFHFYRSNLTGNVKRAINRLMPDADDDCMIVYHFGLYECDSRKASRSTGERSPRVYFLLGANGFIYILFFDPYHELNP